MVYDAYMPSNPHNIRIHTLLLCVSVAFVSIGVTYLITQEFFQPTRVAPLAQNAGLARGTHVAYPQDKEDIKNNFTLSKETTHANVRGAIVNHHLLAGNFIAHTLKSIESKPETIIILSPNHFEIGDGAFTTTDYDWETSFGTLHTNTKIISALEAAGLVNDPRIYPHEHGVTNVIPYIAHEFPDAMIVPIAIKTGASYAAISKLAGAIADKIDQDTLVIASLDFSHNLSSLEAEFHDTQALAAISAVDAVSATRTDVDSPNALTLMLQVMSKIKANQFSLVDHSNASELTKQPDMADVTSYITGIFQAGDITYTQQFTMLTLGDTMLDRYVAKHIKSTGLESYFTTRPRFWLGTDITLANLEGCFTDFNQRALDPNNLFFTFNPSFLSTLRAYQFTTFNLANNHTLNFGAPGLTQCQTYIKDAGLTYYGHPKNSEGISTITEIHGTRVGFVGYNALENTSFNAITDEITRVRSLVDFLIVTPHWGNEYQTIQSSSQTQTAHAMIDAGADLILGTHPHVIQPIEEYNGKFIFYSLGNFIFDQTFSQNTQTSLAAGISLSTDKTEIWLYPLSNANFTISFLDREQRDTLLQELAKKSIVSDELKSGLQNGHIIYP